MFQLIIFIGGLMGVTMASPQWFGLGSHSGFGGNFGGGHHLGGAAPLGPDGRVVDTPEVQHLKSAHLATLAEAAARAPKGPSYDVHDGGYNDIFHSSNHESYGRLGSYDGPRYYGPPAPLGPDGRVVDTPEVEAAKAHHFSLYNAAAQQVPASHHSLSAHPDSHSNYDSGEYNPAWDSPAYNSHY